jgi:hypothetical protein
VSSSGGTGTQPDGLELFAGTIVYGSSSSDGIVADESSFAYRCRIQTDGRDPTPQEWADLNDEIDAKRAELHAPDQP